MMNTFPMRNWQMHGEGKNWPILVAPFNQNFFKAARYDIWITLFVRSFNLFDVVSISMKTLYLTYLHKLISVKGVGFLRKRLPLFLKKCLKSRDNVSSIS